MARKKDEQYPEDMKYEPGTKGHKLAIGGEENWYTFDLDADGGVINLEPVDAPEVESDAGPAQESEAAAAALAE